MTIVIPSSPQSTAPPPSKLFSARELATKVLERIGAFTVNDTGPDPIDLDRALEWMELEIALLAGTERCQWLIPAALEFTLDADEASFNLRDKAGTDMGSLLLMYPISAYIRNSSDDDTEIDLVRRTVYETHIVKDTSGTPEEIFIDRANADPTAYVWPVPADSTLSLRLVFQTYARSILGNASDGESGNLSLDFDRAWQLWIINKTALATGDGPIRQLGNDKLTRLRGDADSTLAKLLSRQNKERTSLRLRRTKRYDY